MRRKYICTNGVVEVTQFVVGDKQTGGRKWHNAKSPEDKRDENARQAVRVAARILNCNYCPEDRLLTLTYTDEEAERLFAGLEQDEILEKAKKQLTDVLSKLHRQLRQKNRSEGTRIATTPAGSRNDRQGREIRIATGAERPRNDGRGREMRSATPSAKARNDRQGTDGAEMKTFSVTSDMDGETGEVVRVHHHVVVTGAFADLLAENWSHGLVHTENLYRQDDYTPLAAYLLGQVRHRDGKKKYSCSRNMTKPKVEEQVLEEMPENEIRVQPGAKVLDRTPYREGMMSQYVRYKRKPKRPKRGGHKEGAAGKAQSCGGTDEKGGSGIDFSKITWG